ncbi:hypothetical protein [Raoultibacter phocaeensis]|uniref:hypothetical protein n=1 Tax=Raoultibacter phocaeensis TaxID=2479841 RepID=UPI00111A62AD|nr:hypothetical protein [Raoultibacter phocaeensis]
MRDDRADRAQQFIPFAALKGYYDLVRQRERTPEPRREQTEEHALRLSRKLAQVRKGSMVAVTHYDKDAYLTTRGIVTDIDTVFRTLTVVKKRMAFEDILDIEGEGIAEDEEY